MTRTNLIIICASEQKILRFERITFERTLLFEYFSGNLQDLYSNIRLERPKLVQKLVQNVQKLVQNVQKLVRNFQKMVQNVRTLVQNVQKLVQNVQKLVQNVKNWSKMRIEKRIHNLKFK